MGAIGPMSPQPLAKPFLSGTAFPSSPATNDVFYRTDRALLYYYDGTRWLTVNLYQLPFVPMSVSPFTANGSPFRTVAAMSPTYDAWLIELRYAVYIVTTNSASHFWHLQLQSGGAATVGISVPNTSLLAPDGWRHAIVPLNVLLGVGQTNMEIAIIKDGSPGNLFLLPSITYRMVG